jgi:LacI family transcriptional regulator
VTLQQIADHLGVSKFAVSRALTGKSGVSAETRQSVIAAAEQFGYAAPRRKGGTAAQAIEVIFHDRTVANRELWVDVQHGIEMEATRAGYSMTVRWTNDHTVIEHLGRTATGYILVGPHEDPMYAAARDHRLPAVIVNHLVPPLDTMDQVSAADVEAGIYVGRFLAGLGHQRMIYAHGKRGYPGREARLYGFAKALAAIEGGELREIDFPDDQNADFRAALVALVRSGFEPTAVFCGSDGVAVTVVSELMRMGLRVPEDISVVGHADYPIATQISPKLTTIHMPHRQMGMAAVRLLLARAGRFGVFNDLPAQRLSLVPWLVERETTAAAPRRSWRPRLRT